MDTLATLTDMGLTLEADGERLIVQPASKLTDDTRALIRDHKAELIAEIERNRRRDELLMMLADNPGVKYVYVTDTSTDPVIVAIGFRDLATFEMTIPAERYDPWKLLAFIDGERGKAQ